jgi:hypothetical protein
MKEVLQTVSWQLKEGLFGGKYPDTGLLFFGQVLHYIDKSSLFTY